MSSKSKVLVAAIGVLALGGIAFVLLRPHQPAEAMPTAPPHLVKPPPLLLRAPPVQPPTFVASAPPVAAVVDAGEAVAVESPDASPAPDPFNVPRLNHHPPPPRSAGARFLALERRYDRAQQAWAVARSHKSPVEQLRYDQLLRQIGNDLGSGSKQRGAEELQEFVTSALDGVEP